MTVCNICEKRQCEKCKYFEPLQLPKVYEHFVLPAEINEEAVKIALFQKPELEK